MVSKVKFIELTQEEYDAMGFYDRSEFLRTENNLYLGDRKLTNEQSNYELRVNDDKSVTLIIND